MTNAKRLRIHRARQLAPRHAVGIENRLVSLLLRHHDVYAAALKARAIEVAKAHQRVDVKGKPSTPKSLARTVHREAERTAEEVRVRVAKALGVKPKDFDIDLTRHVTALSDTVAAIQQEYAARSTERVAETMNEWLNLGELSPRAGDLDALNDMMSDGLEAVASKMEQATRGAFGDAWADMNQDAQRQAGVEQYVWVCEVDKATRPAHLALNGETCDWDDPPLKAAVSSNEEDDHPGEDYSCRCIASPLAPG